MFNKLKDWLNRDVEIQIFDFQKAGRINKKDLPKLSLNGVVLDKSKRKIVKITGSFYVSHPQGWLASVANSDYVETCLVLLDDDSRVILIRKPEEENENGK